MGTLIMEELPTLTKKHRDGPGRRVSPKSHTQGDLLTSSLRVTRERRFGSTRKDYKEVRVGTSHRRE